MLCRNSRTIDHFFAHTIAFFAVYIGHYDGPLGIMGDSSSSGDELEAGELVIDDSYAQLSKKAKKSKKSKKKKEKEREKKHSLKGAKKISKGTEASSPATIITISTYRTISVVIKW